MPSRLMISDKTASFPFAPTYVVVDNPGTNVLDTLPVADQPRGISLARKLTAFGVLAV